MLHVNRVKEVLKDFEAAFSPHCHTEGPARGPSLRLNMAASDADRLRILIATDMHLGYAERDAVRGLDSIRTLEEVLQIAKREKVRAGVGGRAAACWWDCGREWCSGVRSGRREEEEEEKEERERRGVEW